MGDIYLGYGKYFTPKLYLAGEVFIDFAGRKNTLDNSATRISPADDQDMATLNTRAVSQLRTAEFGLDLRPGYLFDTNTLMYGRVGVGFNQLKSNNTTNFLFTYTGTDPALSYNSPLAYNNTKNVAALRLGVGVEHAVSTNLAVTADYIYSYYGSINAQGVADTYSNNGTDPQTTTNGLVSNTSAKLSTQALMLGLKYFFN